MRRAIYAGTFDPLTIGHMDIITRSLDIFDEVIVLVAENTNKSKIFSAEERKDMISEAVAHLPNVKVDCYEGLVVDYAKKANAGFLVRGLRAVQDYESELVMNYGNKYLNKDIEIIYLMADAEYSFISSSTVKEIATYSDRYKELVPAIIAQKYEDKLRKK